MKVSKEVTVGLEIVAGIVIIICVVALGKKLMVLLETGAAGVKGLGAELDGKGQSYTDAQIQNFADNIRDYLNIGGGIGGLFSDDDEKGATDIMLSMVSDGDVLSLQVAFFKSTGKQLFKVLREELDEGNIDIINKYFESKQIQYKV